MMQIRHHVVGVHSLKIYLHYRLIMYTTTYIMRLLIVGNTTDDVFDVAKARAALAKQSWNRGSSTLVTAQ